MVLPAQRCSRCSTLSALCPGRTGAISESFNVGAPSPFTYPEAAEILADQTGREPLEVRLPVRWRYDHDIRKAKSWINFNPKGDLKTMIASARRVESGDYIDYVWD